MIKMIKRLEINGDSLRIPVNTRHFYTYRTVEIPGYNGGRLEVLLGGNGRGKWQIVSWRLILSTYPSYEDAYEDLLFIKRRIPKQMFEQARRLMFGWFKNRYNIGVEVV